MTARTFRPAVTDDELTAEAGRSYHVIHSPYRRAIVEWQEEARDDRSDRVKLEDACRVVLDTVAHRDSPDTVGTSCFAAIQAAARAYDDLVNLINEQFGDEVDVELLAKALAS